jgi:hypothetical protein
MPSKIEIPHLDRFDPDKPLQISVAELYEHQRRLDDALDQVLRGLAGSISEPGGLKTVSFGQLPKLRVNGPPVVLFCPDESGGATLLFNDPAAGVWRRVQDRAVAS